MEDKAGGAESVKGGQTMGTQSRGAVSEERRLVYCLLILFLGFIGGIVINNSYLKPEKWRVRTLSLFFLGILTFGIYQIVVAICALTFDANRQHNIGFFEEGIGGGWNF